MNHHAPPPSRGNSVKRSLRLNPLMACLALVPCAEAAAVVTHVVNTCSDTAAPFVCDGQDDGTLRKAFACAQFGDTIDLTQLQCSKITLAAPLTSDAAAVILAGPGQQKLTIDGGGQSRIFVHHGSPDESLYINDLTVANGHYEKPDTVAGGSGGCVYSTGNVVLNFSTVTSCYASSANVDATGGAIYAKHGVVLDHSTVSGSTVQGNGLAFALGGGIYADHVELNHSTVSGNSATAGTLALAFGGGVAANVIFVDSSTVSGNKANHFAGIDGIRVYLSDSTVSENKTPVDGRVGGVYAGQTARVISSTIARNSSGAGFAAGLFVPVPSAATTLQSTIIAGNEAAGAELDVGTNDGKTILGSNNLIMAHQAGTTVPADTLTDDPLLSSLRDNGGPTQTHALLPGSPAIDHGNHVGFLASDQRLRPRVVGAFPDIGAYEFDPDSIFTTGFGP
jgi:hypothetical protein